MHVPFIAERKFREREREGWSRSLKRGNREPKQKCQFLYALSFIISLFDRFVVDYVLN